MTWLTNMSQTGEEIYFPPELITEILARLPVKSLFRFRCVSKYWLHRIPNPILISSHLHHFTTIKHNTSPIHSLPILTFEYGSESKYFKIRMVNNYEDSVILMTAPATYSTLVSNDGLVLMLDDTTHTKELILVNPILKTSLILVNPTLNTSLVLPPCPIRHSCSRVVYAMGFIPTTNDFKVFAFRIPLTDKETLITAVYTLNHGCWTTRDIEFDNRYILSRSRVLYTKGKVHWLARCSDLWTLVTFDIDSERFSYLGLPPEYVDRDDRGKIHTSEGLFSVGGSVALWCVSELFERIYIWVLDEVGGGDTMWRQLYHGVLTLQSIYFFSHVVPRSSKFWFDDKCSKFYIANKSLLCSYDLRGDEFEYLGCSSHKIYVADTYVESLLLLSHPGADQPRA